MKKSTHMQSGSGHVPLTSLCRTPMPTEGFLGIAIAIIEALDKIHEQCIIYKDLNPQNITVNPKTGEVEISESRLSAHLYSRYSETPATEKIEAELPYISPEQTGRMNRLLDYRSDFYSLGVIYYEMLTGTVPFEGEIASDIIYGHIAKVPEPPERRKPDIPSALSDIILKLLNKDAEDRYQSARGLQVDLEHCLSQLKEAAKIEPFELARKDFSGILSIPHKLYGRSKEESIIIQTFNDMLTGGTQLLLIAGYSGVGKTSLVQDTITRALTITPKGYFLSGKFDQFKQNIPYSALIQAFQGLIQQILAKEDEEVEVWKNKILGAVGTNGQIVIDVIPEVELIIGNQPETYPLPPIESQNRFHYVFQNFVRAFAGAEHPLILFLDDLQWADRSSLQLIELFLSDSDNANLLIIGAYRDNEISSNHPLLTLLGSFEKGDSLTTLTLSPLKKKDVQLLISDTINCDMDVAKPLAELCLEKTRGNPFFLGQFLRTLHQDGLIKAASDRLEWSWDIESIRRANITDNVANLMSRKLEMLPEKTRNVLKFCAALGDRFSLKILSIVLNKSHEAVVTDLRQALLEGLLIPVAEKRIVDNAYTSTSHEDSGCSIEYQFSHDRIHETAYSLIDEEDKAEIHLEIGRILLNNFTEECLRDYEFYVTNHLNLGRDLVNNEEKKQIAKLNLQAGKRAKDSVAFSQALEYFRTGISLLSEDSWDHSYNLFFELHKECYECEFISTNFDKAESLFNTIIAHVSSLIDKAAIYNIAIQQYTIETKYEKAIEMGKSILLEMGLSLPRGNELEKATLKEMERVEASLESRNIEDLVDLPLLEDSQKRALITILVGLEPPSYFSDFPFFKYIVSKATNFGILEGNSPEMPLAYSNFGLVLSISGNSLKGFEFGSLAVALSKKLNSFKCVSHNTMGLCINHWVRHVNTSEEIANKGIHYGLEEGEIQFVCYNHFGLLNALVSQGMPLDQLVTRVDQSLDFVRRNKNTMSEMCFLSIRQFARNLQGRTTDKLSFNDATYNEEKFLESSRGLMMSMAYFYAFKLQSCYLFADYDGACRMAECASQFIHQVGPFLTSANYTFFHSLSLAAQLSRVSERERRSYWQQLGEYRKQLESWANDCPENFLCMLHLVDAEIARTEKNYFLAMELYDQAITSAHDSRFIHYEAIANELCASFWLERGKEEFSRLHMENARACYEQWGSFRKVQDLEERYPQLLVRTPAGTIPQGSSPSDSASNISTIMDSSSLIKATRALSAEFRLDELLGKLLSLLLENVGAQKAILVIKRDNTFSINAVGLKGPNGIITECIPLDAADRSETPVSLIHYVIRTGSDLVLDNAAQQGDFVNDDYIRQEKIRSALVSPILYQKDLIGVIYLENRLTTGAFTEGRLELIRVLAAQAAISIVNAQRTSEVIKAKALLSQAEEVGKLGGWSLNIDTRELTWTDAVYKIHETDLNYIPTVEEAIGFYTPESQPVIREALCQTLDHGIPFDIELEIITAKGNMRSVHAIGQSDPINRQVYGCFQDITERKQQDLERLRMKEELQQAEKLSAVGQLAGGIAHDFNNMLGGIVGGVDLLSEWIPKEETPQKFLDIILTSAERASHLASQLLAFARKQEKVFALIDLHAVIRDTITILRSTIDKRVVIESRLEADQALVMGDSGQLQNVFLNLGINASQAMPEGGTLSFESTIINLDASHCDTSPFELVPGCYVEMIVRDTGCGIPSELQTKIFDPFFTTKEKGRGTGLGLSVAYGTVSLHGGEIKVFSDEISGTRFHVRLPLTQGEAEPGVQGKVKRTGSGTILVIDDEEAMRVTAKAFLEGCGYTVLLATEGKEGVDCYREKWREIDLVICDMIMPRMNGMSCFKALKTINPDVRFILSSGFSHADDIAEMKLHGLVDVINKPYRGIELSEVVANGLSGKNMSGESSTEETIED